MLQDVLYRVEGRNAVIAKEYTGIPLTIIPPASEAEKIEEEHEPSGPRLRSQAQKQEEPNISPAASISPKETKYNVNPEHDATLPHEEPDPRGEKVSLQTPPREELEEPGKISQNPFPQIIQNSKVFKRGRGSG